ncbi:35095_t:CDS:1 [Racocetra persica]|uniref:35095_t:CDS:1 n=1 Tax=Racocetra persica TaxID=160502 RepID=A0ACA9NJU2_9GLOM|nr:35095_t:CDS:1 [Racocetra persica]
MSNNNATVTVKKQMFNLIQQRINGESPLIKPTHNPIILKTEEEWNEYFKTFSQRKKQLQINYEWEEFCSRFEFSVKLLEKVGNDEFEFESQKKKKTDELIKKSLPYYDRNDYMRKKKFHKSIELFVEKSKEKEVPLDFCRQELTGMGFTVNSLSEGSDEEIQTLFR